VSDAIPLFAPTRPTFPCPGLLALAARAGLGGARECLLGAVMAARLASGMRTPYPLPRSARQARAEGARAWLGAITLPAKARAALLKAFAASATNDRGVMADALGGVTDVTANHLDRVARSELVRMADGLRTEGLELAGGPGEPVE
jgi:hypothetical protein